MHFPFSTFWARYRESGGWAVVKEVGWKLPFKWQWFFIWKWVFKYFFPEVPFSRDAQYCRWLLQNMPRVKDFDRMAVEMQNWSYYPKISVLMPVYNAPESFLRDAIESVQNQIYPHWEFCIADDASPLPHVRQILTEYADQDPRIKLALREKNGHISQCSNSALALATGEFIALLDHDDVLTPDALHAVVDLLNQHPEAGMVYSDEDKIDFLDELSEPTFKPDWSPEALLSRMYIGHLGVYRRTSVRSLGGFREGYEGSQDYDLALRFTEQDDRVFHIPKILYHWRVHEESSAGTTETKPYAYQAAEKALSDALLRRQTIQHTTSSIKFGNHNSTSYVESMKNFPGIFIPRWRISKEASVSVFCRNGSDFQEYPNCEVIAVGTPAEEEWNVSQLSQEAVSRTRGKYLLFFDTRLQGACSDWVARLMEYAQHPQIGAVGACLLNQNLTIAHAGVVLGVKGIASPIYMGMPISNNGHASMLKAVNNFSAVIGDCLLCRRDAYEQVGGIDSTLSVYWDIDFCLKLVAQGYRNVCLPHVWLTYTAQANPRSQPTPQEIETMQNRWQKLIENDPCYNPNFTRHASNYQLRIRH